MKVRNGYVSNSSSSSFLVIYKDESDFDKFKSFNGFDEFISDLASSDKKEVFSFLNTEAQSVLYDFYDAFIKEMEGYNNHLMDLSRTTWNDLTYDFEYKDTILQKKIRVLKKGFEEGKSKEEMEELFYKQKTNREVKKLVEHVENKGWKLGVVEYEDDTKFGAYMETKFMPFLARNPEDDFYVYIMNCH